LAGEGINAHSRTEATAREQILAVLDDCAAAITAEDAHRAVAHLAPDVVSFSLAPPLREAGDEVRDPAGTDGWFRTWDGPIGYDIGERADLWFRSTVGSAGRSRAGRSPTCMTPPRSTWMARTGPPMT
jgi:ketosteroid isomerase-like protein